MFYHGSMFFEYFEHSFVPIAWRMQLFWYFNDVYIVCLLNRFCFVTRKYMLIFKIYLFLNFQLICETTISKFHKINCNDHCNCVVILKCSWCKKNLYFTYFLKIFTIANWHRIFLSTLKSAIELKKQKIRKKHILICRKLL